MRGRFLVPADGWWFRGRFPDRPVMPGVLTIEAIAQCGAVAVLADESDAGKAEAGGRAPAAASSVPAGTAGDGGGD